MSEIQVNTNDLYNGSQNLKAAADEIGNIQNQVGSAAVSVGNSYNGQLRQAIEGIVGGSAQTGTRLQSRANELGNELRSRAVGYEAANETGFRAMLASSNQLNIFIKSSSSLKTLLFLNGFDNMKAGFLWGIGGFGIGTIFSWTTSLFNDAKELTSALYLTKNLGWSNLRPNSIIFRGPNWMRKALGIKEATRVIKPVTLATGMVVTGLATSGLDAAGAIKEDITDSRYQTTSQKISAATTDGKFRFAISAVGTVGIPLLLGTTVAVASPFLITAGVAAGTVTIAGGAVVLAGTVIGDYGYEKYIETPTWEAWKQSSTREEIIENQANQIDKILDFTKHLHDKAINQVNEAFHKPIDAIVSSP